MTDLAVALFVALLVLGGMHLPKLGDALGRAVRRSGRAPAAGEPPRPEPPPK